MGVGILITDKVDFKTKSTGTSLVVQWLRLHESTAGGVGSIPGWGTKISHATQCGQKTKQNTKTNPKSTIKDKKGHYIMI